MIDEPNETFVVDLATPTNVTLTDDQGQTKIVNHDPVPTIAMNTAIVIEGMLATFTVSLSKPSSAPVMVQFATANGTATAVVRTPTNTCIGDTIATSGPRAFTNTQTIQTIRVSVVADTYRDSRELCFLNRASPTNVMIADGQGVGTILARFIGHFTLPPTDTGYEAGEQQAIVPASRTGRTGVS
jgi:hypothetical protein